MLMMLLQVLVVMTNCTLWWFVVYGLISFSLWFFVCVVGLFFVCVVGLDCVCVCLSPVCWQWPCH